MKVINIIIALLIVMISITETWAQILPVEDYIKKQSYQVIYWKETLRSNYNVPIFRVLMKKSRIDLGPKQYEYLFLKSWLSDDKTAYFYFMPTYRSSSEKLSILTPDLQTIKYYTNNTNHIANRLEQEETMARIDTYCQTMSEYRYYGDRQTKFNFFEQAGIVLGCFGMGYIFDLLPESNPKDKSGDILSAMFYILGIVAIPNSIHEHCSMKKTKENMRLLKGKLELQSAEADSLSKVFRSLHRQEPLPGNIQP